jgi:hypothetical protein
MRVKCSGGYCPTVVFSLVINRRLASTELSLEFWTIICIAHQSHKQENRLVQLILLYSSSSWWPSRSKDPIIFLCLNANQHLANRHM